MPLKRLSSEHLCQVAICRYLGAKAVSGRTATTQCAGRSRGVCIWNRLDGGLISGLVRVMTGKRGLAHLFTIPLLTTPAAAFTIDDAGATATAARVVVHVGGVLVSS